MKNLSILVVDSDPVSRRLLDQQLTKKNYFVQVAENGLVAKKMLEQQIFNVVITDLIIPGDIGGLEVLEIAKANDNKTEVVILTTSASINTALKAMKKGAIDYLEKPINYDEVMLCIDKLAQTHTISGTPQDHQSSIGTSEVSSPPATPVEEAKKSKFQLALETIEKTLRDDLLPDSIKIEKALEIIANSRG